MDTLVSIIVPTYNRPDLLSRALDSIAAQTYRDYEVLVVNDAGLDVSNVVKRFSGAKYYRHGVNRGLAAARNTALKHAQGHYIAYLDDDDWYYSRHLEALVSNLESTGYRAAYTDAHGIQREEISRQLYCSREYSQVELLDHNLFPVLCVMHERSLIDEVGKFDETLRNHEDWDLWIRISAVTPYLHVREATCAVDRTRETMNSDREAMLEGFDLVRNRYRNMNVGTLTGMQSYGRT